MNEIVVSGICDRKGSFNAWDAVKKVDSSEVELVCYGEEGFDFIFSWFSVRRYLELEGLV